MEGKEQAPLSLCRLVWFLMGVAPRLIQFKAWTLGVGQVAGVWVEMRERVCLSVIWLLVLAGKEPVMNLLQFASPFRFV